MMNLTNLSKKERGSLAIDFTEAEQKVGFPLCEGIKSLYTRSFGEMDSSVLNLREKVHIKPQGTRWDTWFSFNNCEGNCEVMLSMPGSEKELTDFIAYGFHEWTGGNDFGKRMMIGSLFVNIGDICILLNNDTGKIEWIDCGYGYFDTYDENPNGVLADSIEEFLGFFE
ncbi:hypothetical protein [Paenibacillus sp. IHBB 3054]|uniref:hypothetical protein n=1 Tax=Paenibacillus sp. IHBB 3054 TaxID=3425689 RepID=UPI003F670E98